MPTDPTAEAQFAFQSRFLLEAAAAAGVSEEDLAQRVRRLFRRLTTRVAPTVTLEIGAFEASFSRWARAQLPQARVLAFEANPHVHAHFRDEVSAAGVEYVHACVGVDDRPVTLHVPADFYGRERDLVNPMASLRTNLHTEQHHAVEVPGVRLDQVVLAGPADRVVAWIDVEGALEQVIGGGAETLARADVVYVEVEDAPLWDGQWLDTDVARWFREAGLVPILRDLQRPPQYNLLLVSRDLATDPAVARLAGRVLAAPKRAYDEAPLPEPVAGSAAGRVQRLLRPSLRQEIAELEAQNRQLRKRAKRLSRRVGQLSAQLSDDVAHEE